MRLKVSLSSQISIKTIKVLRFREDNLLRSFLSTMVREEMKYLISRERLRLIKRFKIVSLDLRLPRNQKRSLEIGVSFLSKRVAEVMVAAEVRLNLTTCIKMQLEEMRER